MHTVNEEYRAEECTNARAVTELHAANEIREKRADPTTVPDWLRDLARKKYCPSENGTARYQPVQHFFKPIAIRETSSPLGKMLIDCLQGEDVTIMLAENVFPRTASLKPSPVMRPLTLPFAE